MLGRSVRGALLLAAALDPHERTSGGEEPKRRSGAKSASAAPAAAAGAQGAGGWSRELPVGLHGRGGQHGQLHGTDKELGAVAVPVLCAEAGSRHEVALFEERNRDLQRRVISGVSERDGLHVHNLEHGTRGTLFRV